MSHPAPAHTTTLTFINKDNQDCSKSWKAIAFRPLMVPVTTSKYIKRKE